MDPRPTLEICCETPSGVRAAKQGGADGVELCSALDLGGLTPGAGLVRAALDAADGLPVQAMVRPRAGDFVLDDDDLEACLADIAFMRRLGVAGVVFGAAAADGGLDVPALDRLVAASAGMTTTLHRVVDLCPDPVAAVAVAEGLGFDRILTSGGAPRAIDGAATLRRMATAARRVQIVAGGGVSADTAPDILRTGVRALHASCGAERRSAGAMSRLSLPEIQRRTDPGAVAALRRSIDMEAAA